MTAVSLKAAYKYPFKRAKGMLNIFWLLFPIIGWFALVGYGVRIAKEFIRGHFNQLPTMSFSADLKLGFLLFVKSVPLMALYILFLVVTSLLAAEGNAALGALSDIVQVVIALFVLPVISMNLIEKQTVASTFEFGIAKHVFANLGDYILALLKSIVVGISFLLLWVILIGIPAGSFTKNIFIADFYGRRIKRSQTSYEGADHS